MYWNWRTAQIVSLLFWKYVADKLSLNDENIESSNMYYGNAKFNNAGMIHIAISSYLSTVMLHTMCEAMETACRTQIIIGDEMQRTESSRSLSGDLLMRQMLVAGSLRSQGRTKEIMAELGKKKALKEA